MNTSESIIQIAAKLRHEHITSANYTRKRAEEVLMKCVGWNFIQSILNEYENEIIAKMDEIVIKTDYEPVATFGAQLNIFDND